MPLLTGVLTHPSNSHIPRLRDCVFMLPDFQLAPKFRDLAESSKHLSFPFVRQRTLHLGRVHGQPCAPVRNPPPTPQLGNNRAMY
jgi:hypothetical protein